MSGYGCQEDICTVMCLDAATEETTVNMPDRQTRMEENMNISQYFKSIIDEDRCAVVICNLEHEIIYMNPAAIARYEKSGGADLVGQNLLDCHGSHSQEMIRKVVLWFRESKEHKRIYTFHNEKENRDVYMVALRDEDGTLIGYYEKHEYRNAETSGMYQFG